MAHIAQQGRSYQELQSLSAAVACLFVMHILMPRLPRGLPRVFCALPFFPIFGWVSFSTRPHTLRSLLSFMFLWIGPSKLLLRCYDISADYPGPGFLYFLATTVMPFRVKGRTHPFGKRQKASFAQIAGGYPGWVNHALYCLLVYLGLEGMIGVVSNLTSLLLGVELYPLFDKPFLASSLSEFWGRRWNRLASYMLRETVYVPTLHLLTAGRQERKTNLHSSTWNMSVRSPQTGPAQNPDLVRSLVAYKEHGTDPSRSNNGLPATDERKSAVCYEKSRTMRKPPLPARTVALLASFVASGLIHELIFYCITQTHATWEVTMFFILHGIATALEVYLRRRFPNFTNLPRPIAIFYTLTLVFISAAWLFMPPVIRSGLDLRILAEFSQLQSAILDLLRRH